MTLAGQTLAGIRKNCLWRPVEWCPFDVNAPLSGVFQSRNRDLKYFKINNALYFVERQDLGAGLYPTSIINNATTFNKTTHAHFTERK